MAKVSKSGVVSDVEPFLISPDESQLLTLDNLERLLVKGPYPK